KAELKIDNHDCGNTERYAALFDLIYPWMEGTPEDALGKVLYVKNAVYKGNPLAAPRDVIEYASRSPQFPHEPTSDQFFRESQFESYRALGEHEIAKVMSKMQ